MALLNPSGLAGATDEMAYIREVLSGQIASTFPGWAVSASAPAILDNGTIATTGVNVARVTPAAAKTGIIMAAGTIDGQLCVVENKGSAASRSLTFAAVGTSNVHGGVSVVIPGGASVLFKYDMGNAYWEPLGVSSTFGTIITPSAGIAPATGTGSTVFHSGGLQPATTTTGTDTTPSVTETYIAEVFVPANATLTGVAVLNGSAVAGNLVVALYDNTGAAVANSALAGTAQSGTAAYQQVPFTATYAAIGPAKYFIGLQCNNTSARFRSHILGNFGASKKTAEVFGTLTTVTPPTTFTTGQGPIADVY